MAEDQELPLGDMIAMAQAARQRAYAPYSRHPVGAALLADDGRIYAGCNVENAAYPLGSCAEATAIGQMVLAGAARIRHMVVIGPGEAVCPPCGGCRQRLREFAGDELVITLCSGAGEVLEAVTLGALLPLSFGPDNVASVQARETLA